MSAILASFLPDFSDALTPPPALDRAAPARLAPPQAPQAALQSRPQPAPGAAPRAAPAQPGIIPLAVALAAVANPVPPAPADPFANPWAGLKRPAAEAAPAEPVETPEARTALLAEAEARGREERAGFEARFAEARRQWSESEAEALAAGFSAALRALDAELTERIARLLVPVLTDALRRRAVDELGDALRRLLADPQAAQVRVSGPEDLLAALCRRLGPLADAVAFAPGAAPEVSVSADQTVIETQLAAWTRLLAAAVAED